MIIDATKNYYIRKFEFVSLHNEEYLNVRQALSEMPINKFCYKMENCSFHDLTTIITPPPNLHLSLGLGQKFIIQKPLPNLNFTPTMERLRRDIRVKFFYAGEEGLQNHPFNRNNYIPSEWIPPLAHPDIEEMMNDLQTIVEKEKQKIKREKHSNLTKAQQDSLNTLVGNPNLIVALADKGLGPVVLERDTYNTRVFKDHLNDKNTYKEISPGEAQELFGFVLHGKVKKFYEKYKPFGVFSNEEQTYFDRLLNKEKHRIPQFYITIKVHKRDKDGNWKTRPVVGACGSIINGLSKWVDYWLSMVAKTIPTYIKDSDDLLRKLKKIGKVKRGTKLIVADATSMYTNINTDHAIKVIGEYIRKFRHELPPEFPVEALLEALEIVMKNAYFQYGGKFFHQIAGTSMGTSCACSYATSYYGAYERLEFLRKYAWLIILLCRFIDDTLKIQEPGNERTAEEQTAYEADYNFGDLTFTFEESYESVDFLDLTIQIDQETGEITTKTYQKPCSLHLYIPPHSAHPAGCTKGLIFGILRRYYKQNTKIEDFKKIASLFHERLLARGYKRENIDELFIEAAEKFDEEESIIERGLNTSRVNSHQKRNNNAKRKPDENLMIHIEYHPRDISRKRYQEMISETLFNSPKGSINDKKNHEGGKLNITKPIIAYSRGKNIRDLVMSSKFTSKEKLLEETRNK